MKTITALEISKNLPMRVKSLDTEGMFAGTVIRFDKANEQGRLIGKVVGSAKTSICVLFPTKKFGLLN